MQIERAVGVNPRGDLTVMPLLPKSSSPRSRQAAHGVTFPMRGKRSSDRLALHDAMCCANLAKGDATIEGWV